MSPSRLEARPAPPGAPVRPTPPALTPRVAITDRRYRLGQRPPNAGRTFPIELLTPREVQMLIDACPTNRKAGVRNRALIVLLWRTGLRVSEACALYPKDLDVTNGTITVLHGKGPRGRGKRRTIGIDPVAIAQLQPWLALHATLGLGPDDPLLPTVFANNFGHQLNPSYVRDLLKRLARDARIAKRVHPHGLRHTHASELANEDVPLHLIQLQLGHNSLATTETYIRHLAPTHLMRVIRARPWPAAAAGESDG